MKLTYFKENENMTADELRKEFYKLVKMYHPDLNKDKDTTEIMKLINQEFEYLQTNIGKKYDTNDYKNTVKYRFFDDESIKDYGFIIIALEKLLREFPEITIELVGCYFWISLCKNFYKKNKDVLKNKFTDLGFSYNSKRQKWMRSPLGKKRKTRYSNGSFNDIKDKYGSEEMKTRPEKMIV